MKLFRFLAPVLLLLSALSAAHAQLAVTVSVKERFYIRHEPIIATVSITNNSGRDIEFTDIPQTQWFSFRIRTAEDIFVPARDNDYHLRPLSLRSGETIKRSVDINQLYEMGEFGIYSIRATIYSDQLDKYFSSQPTVVEITDGHVIWRKTAGVPEGQTGSGDTRVFSLLTHQRGEVNMMFVRVEDQKTGDVYCTYPLCRMLEGAVPMTQFDASNNLYVLELVGMRQYLLSKIGIDGKFMGQTNYITEKYQPTFRKLPSGELLLVGAKRLERPTEESTPVPAPKLSDRPSSLPKSN